jgi:hypothetical protein
MLQGQGKPYAIAKIQSSDMPLFFTDLHVFICSGNTLAIRIGRRLKELA